jgi:hypothetical protein
MKLSGIVLLVSACCAAAVCATGSGGLVLRESRDVWGKEGARVVIEGKVANEIWQHMMAPAKGYPHETYFDMGRGQIVIYTKNPVECAGIVRASGTVVKLEGSSKDPRRKETCTEYHVAVDSWECLK